MIQFLALKFLGVFDLFHKRKMVFFLKKNKFINFKIVFDVGAHKGETIEFCLDHFNIEKIYSFEPSHFSFKNLNSGLIKVSKKISGKEKKVIKIDMHAMKDFQHQLEILLAKIINDDFTQTSDIKACEWCDYKSICKK